MTKSSEGRKQRYRTRPDGKTVGTVHSTDPSALEALMQWALTSTHPDAMAVREMLSKRDLTGYTPPDIMEIRHVDDKLQ